MVANTDGNKFTGISPRHRVHRPAKYVEGGAGIICAITFVIGVFMFGLLDLYGPCDCSTAAIKPNQRIGVVGAGISGLAAAWRLREAGYDVTVFEEYHVLGGAAATYRDYRNSSKPHDMGFRIWHSTAYPNFEQLLLVLNHTDHVVTLGTSLLSFSHPEDPPTIVTDGSSPPVNLSQVPALDMHSDYTSPWSGEIDRLGRVLNRARDSYSEREWMTETVSTFLKKNGFSDQFVLRHFIPCLNVYVATGQVILETPVAIFAAANSVFSRCFSRGRVTVQTMNDGIDRYVEKMVALMRSIGVHFKVNSTVDQLIPRADSESRVKVVLTNGKQYLFDHIINTVRLPDAGHMERATADDIKRDLFSLREDPSSLSYAPYVRTSCVVHNYSLGLEPALWNDSRSCWQAELYHIHTFANASFMFASQHQRENTAHGADCAQTDAPPIGVFYSYENTADTFIPRSNQLYTRPFRLPPQTANYMRAGHNLHKVQGRDRIWYAGIDTASFNIHETALVSGLVVARELGATYPWPDAPYAAGFFLKLQQWMMHGSNWFVERATRR